MEEVPLPSRLAQRLRWPVAMVGGASAVFAIADLLSWVPDQLTAYAAVGVGLSGATFFFCAVFNMKFQRAVAALNFGRRREGRERGGLIRLMGFGLPVADRVLPAFATLSLIVMLVAKIDHRVSAAALSFASFFLLCVIQIGLIARGQPTSPYLQPRSRSASRPLTIIYRTTGALLWAVYLGLIFFWIYLRYHRPNAPDPRSGFAYAIQGQGSGHIYVTQVEQYLMFALIVTLFILVYIISRLNKFFED
jgi:hypothetical protein